MIGFPSAHQLSHGLAPSVWSQSGHARPPQGQLIDQVYYLQSSTTVFRPLVTYSYLRPSGKALEPLNFARDPGGVTECCNLAPTPTVALRLPVTDTVSVWFLFLNPLALAQLARLRLDATCGQSSFFRF